MPQGLKVTGPDGKVYNFPSDATDSEIAAFFEPSKPNRRSALTGEKRPETTLPSWMSAGADASMQIKPKESIAGAQIALALTPSPLQAMTIPAVLGMAAAQGSLGALKDGPTAGVTDAVLGAGLPTGMKLLKGPALRMWSNAAGSEAGPKVAEEVLSRGAGRLTPSNTGVMQKAADAAQEWVPNVPRDAAGRIIPGPRLKPSGPSPLQPAVDAHRSGVERAAVSPNLPQNMVGAAYKLATHPGMRANAARAMYGAATGDGGAMANAVRLALEALYGGGEPPR